MWCARLLQDLGRVQMMCRPALLHGHLKAYQNCAGQGWIAEIIKCVLHADAGHLMLQHVQGVHITDRSATSIYVVTVVSRQQLR